MKTKQQKRFDAEARQTEYDALTPQQKLDQARSRRGLSAREIARVEAVTS